MRLVTEMFTIGRRTDHFYSTIYWYIVDL